MIKVESGVPLPKGRGGADQGISSTIRGLEVGQSFLVPAEWGLASVRAIAYSMEGRKFSIRKQDNNQRRCWRVS